MEMNNENKSFSTPKKKSTRSTCEVGKESCSVCLSPFCHPSTKSVVETRCNHFFHHNCLEEAKFRNPICPLCRTNLVSPQKVGNGNESFLSSNETANSSLPIRTAIISAAQRGRNAVRRAMERRQYESSLIQLQSNDCQNIAVY